MFRRRNPLPFAQRMAELIYPRGGWRRAARYIAYRVRRLPDPAHKISRGIACGIFASWTPFFGLHFIIAAACAHVIRGNILAALLATFVGNPLTFPIIAAISVETGTRILDMPHVPPASILFGFSLVSVELWGNFYAIFGDTTMVWDQSSQFFQRIFIPYAVGGIGPGLVASVAGYYISYPVIASYQRGRIKKMKKRLEARRRLHEKEKIKRGEEPEPPPVVAPKPGE